MHPKNAVVLLSGGLDSATTLAVAASEDYRCHCLSFDYGQRNRLELDAARRVAAAGRSATHKIVPLHLDLFGGSALTDVCLAVPKDGPARPAGGAAAVPITYVPARNTIFLSYGLAYAEAIDADAVFIGVNSVDYSGYPDCRPAFISAFQTMADTATARAATGRPIQIRAPLQNLGKAGIISWGTSLGVDYALTLTCYDPDAGGAACGGCEACRLRSAGFRDAGLADPTRYRADS